MDNHNLIILLPLENIPNMPPDPAGRQRALQAIRAALAQHAAQMMQGALSGQGALGG